jgi:hypothetical protein
MSRCVIIIAFQDSEGELIHRIRCFGEDIFREFSRGDKAVIDIHEIDRATNQLSVTLHSTRHFGDVSIFINKMLKRHGLADVATVSKTKLAAEPR